MTLRVCLLGLLKGRRGNILAGSKTFRLRINRFKNFPLRNTILLSQRTRDKDKNYFVDLQKLSYNLCGLVVLAELVSSIYISVP